MQIRIKPEDLTCNVGCVEDCSTFPGHTTEENDITGEGLSALYDVDSRMPITAKLKSLRKGDSVSFPIERRQSVYAVANRLKKELVKWAWNFKLIDNTENFTVTIVRIS